MRRVQVNAIVDLLALITLVPSVITGIVLLIVLPVGSSLRSVFLGITRFQWIRVHDVTSVALAVLIVLHIALHWKFYRKIARILRTGNEEDMRK
ncbi:MAG: DUF4405 domain-containing protein [Methanoregulaceae archaeon]|nr:DUF4405 domain-containing protein [Methanoregulaceae archaeon]